jgi:hypothetical protein
MSMTPQTSREHSTENTIQQFLVEHPRMIGALFMLVLVLAQAGDAAAANASSIAGP